MPSRVGLTAQPAAPESSVIRESSTSHASKLTAPSRRSEELARLEKDVLHVDAPGADDGHKTTVMETMSLVEAERQIAKEAMDGVQSGVREIAAVPVQGPAVSPQVAALPEPHSEIFAHARRRRRAALWVVAAVLGAALVLIAVSLARRGWSMPGRASAPAAQPQR